MEAEYRKQPEACARHPQAPHPGERSWPWARGLCRQRAFSIYFVFYNKEMARPPDFPGPSPGSEARAQAPGALSSCLSPFGRR